MKAPNTATPLIEKAPNKFFVGVSLAITAVFISALIAAAGKHLSTQVSVLTIVVFQYGISLLCTLPWLAKNLSSALHTLHWRMHIVRAVSGCLCFYSYYAALKYIPLVDASLLRSSAPLFVPLVIVVWLKQLIPKTAYFPLILGFIGVVIILRPGQSGASIWHLVGLLSGVGLAVSMISTRMLSSREPEQKILFYYFAMSVIFVTPFYIAEFTPVPAAALPGLIGIGVAMYFNFAMYTRAYSYVKASILAPTSYFGVVFAGLLDWSIWGITPDHWAIFGAVLVSLGGLLVVRQRPQQ